MSLGSKERQRFSVFLNEIQFLQKFDCLNAEAVRIYPVTEALESMQSRLAQQFGSGKSQNMLVHSTIVPEKEGCCG